MQTQVGETPEAEERGLGEASPPHVLLSGCWLLALRGNVFLLFRLLGLGLLPMEA